MSAFEKDTLPTAAEARDRAFRVRLAEKWTPEDDVSLRTVGARVRGAADEGKCGTFVPPDAVSHNVERLLEHLRYTVRRFPEYVRISFSERAFR